LTGAYVVFSMQRICEKHVHFKSFVVEIRITQTRHSTKQTRNTKHDQQCSAHS
jgi:hypothetical protein